MIILKQNIYADAELVGEIKEALKNGDEKKLKELKKGVVNKRRLIYSGAGALLGANKTRKKWNDAEYTGNVGKKIDEAYPNISKKERSSHIRGQKITDAVVRSAGRGAIGYLAGGIIGKSKFNSAYRQAERELKKEQMIDKLADRVLPTSSESSTKKTEKKDTK